MPKERKSIYVRSASSIALLALAMLLAGCDESATDPLAQLMRANHELTQQVEAQTRVMFAMGGACILLGVCTAMALGALWWRKGGRSSVTTTERTGAR